MLKFINLFLSILKEISGKMTSKLTKCLGKFLVGKSLEIYGKNYFPKPVNSVENNFLKTTKVDPKIISKHTFQVNTLVILWDQM